MRMDSACVLYVVYLYCVFIGGEVCMCVILFIYLLRSIGGGGVVDEGAICIIYARSGYFFKIKKINNI